MRPRPDGLCRKNIINHEMPSNSYINYYIRLIFKIVLWSIAIQCHTIYFFCAQLCEFTHFQCFEYFGTRYFQVKSYQIFLLYKKERTVKTCNLVTFTVWDNNINQLPWGLEHVLIGFREYMLFILCQSTWLTATRKSSWLSFSLVPDDKLFEALASYISLHELSKLPDEHIAYLLYLWTVSVNIQCFILYIMYWCM